MRSVRCMLSKIRASYQRISHLAAGFHSGGETSLQFLPSLTKAVATLPMLSKSCVMTSRHLFFVRNERSSSQSYDLTGNISDSDAGHHSHV